MPPIVPGEVWEILANPFVVSETTLHLKGSALRLNQKIGEMIQIASYPLRITSAGIFDSLPGHCPYADL
jgi:hypothetical protein